MKLIMSLSAILVLAIPALLQANTSSGAGIRWKIINNSSTSVDVDFSRSNELKAEKTISAGETSYTSVKHGTLGGGTATKSYETVITAGNGDTIEVNARLKAKELVTGSVKCTWEESPWADDDGLSSELDARGVNHDKRCKQIKITITD